MIFRRFPYTTLNDINLDWIIKQVKLLITAVQGKQDKPESAGTAGQVLGLDSNLDPVWVDQSGGGGGTTNYNSLENKPQIQGVTLTGNKTASDLGLALSADLAEKQDAPALAGTAGQVLGLDSNLNPVWVNQSGGGGTTNYNSLENKPQINGVTLTGNKTTADLGLTSPVTSVNNQTGAVNLTASDVGALPSSTTIPTGSLALPLMDGTASAGTNLSRFAMEGHVHPTDTTRQAVINASGILKGAGSGSISAATLGTDYGGLAFVLTLTVAGWLNKTLIISNANFIASGFAYIVIPAGTSIKNYSAAEIYADTITTDGQITFHCTTTPTTALTVNILRVVSA